MPIIITLISFIPLFPVVSHLNMEPTSGYVLRKLTHSLTVEIVLRCYGSHTMSTSEFDVMQQFALIEWNGAVCHRPRPSAANRFMLLEISTLTILIKFYTLVDLFPTRLFPVCLFIHLRNDKVVLSHFAELALIAFAIVSHF